MLWLSKDVEQLIAQCQSASAPFSPDVLVVGSGYGGAVAALRFAEHGLSVALLERGGEYLAGGFPTDLSQTGAFIRAESSANSGANAVGNEDALFDFRLGTRASALVGNGLGGGSLINAAVALRPDARVFEQAQWPEAIRNGTLDDDFQQAYAGLEIQSPSVQAASPACAPQQTAKYQRLQDIGQAAAQQFANDQLSVSTEDVPLAIEFRPSPSQALGPRAACIGCGNCVSGCNQQAKLSLDKTYLPRARQAGAELFTHVSVLFIEHLANQPERPWRVHCVRTSERAQWQALQQNGAPERADYEFVIPCGRVILAAGTFGSSEILLRSHALGLDVANAWLGHGISANGDDLCAAYDLPDTANGMGRSSVVTPDTVTETPACGPTISAVIRFHHHSDHRQSTIIEDGAIPGLLAPLANELLSTLGVLPQLARFGLRGKRGRDPLAVQPEIIARSLALLGMGHDSAAGVATLVNSGARLNWSWPENAADPAPQLHRQRMASIKKIGGEFLPNPASGLLPDEIAQVLSGPTPQAGWITVHPLGGCRMADCVQDGVVNDRGQLFRSDGSVHASLQVLDGSIIPSSLGVNPLLTITALAERACRLTLVELAAGKPCTQALDAYPSTTPAFTRSATPVCGAVLAEVLRGPLHWQDSPQAAPQTLNGALFLQMDVPDWQQVWQDPKHRVAAIAYNPQAANFTASRLVIDRLPQPALELQVSGGSVELFRALADTPLARGSRFTRAFLTYLINRWWPDRSRAKPANPPGLLANLSSGAHLLWHASAARSFVYQLQLSDGQHSYRLHGSKLIQPAATWRELWQWLRTTRQHGGWPVLPRRSVWEQLSELDVQLYRDDSPHLLAAGRLGMDFPEMLRRIAPQLNSGPDSVHALAAMASYPLLITRYLISSRILDFRLPDYAANLPISDPALAADNGLFELEQQFYPSIELADGGKVAAQAPVCLHVPLHADQPQGEQIRTGLVRYAQPQVQSQLVNGQRRFKSIMLLNGFAQNTLPFVAEELGSRSLAAMLYAKGWDVWLLEYRVSPLLRASAQFSSMDDIAAGEIPKAIDYILEQLSETAGDTPPVPGEMFCFSHCVGSASLGMSLLGGHLTHKVSQRAKLAGVLFSQFQPFVIGSKTAQMRVQVAALLVNGLGRELLEFAAGTVQADALHALMDRLFASFDYAAAERCPGEQDLRHEHPDSTTCKRMAGALSRLFRHDQLLPITHAKLDQYFGRTNLGVFMHGAKCVEYERLVNANGQNVYATESNLREFLPMPVMLLHGADNVLFDQESCTETWRQLRRTFSTQRLQHGHDHQLIAAEHAHFDCTIGRQAPEKIFSEVVGFFNAAYAAPAATGSDAPHNRLRARLPRSGPIVGWCRSEGETSRLRLWIEVDNSQSGEAVAAMTLLCAGAERTVQAWPLHQQALNVALGSTCAPSADAGISYALADIEVPNSWLGSLSIAMVSLHRYTASEPAQAEHCELHWPADWGQPMTVAEAQAAGGRTPTRQANAANPTSCAVPPPATRHASPQPALISQLSAASISQTLQPLALQLNLSDAQALLYPLSISLQESRQLASQAQPATLSRQRRSLRWMRECVVRLRAEQWQPNNTFSFLAASCRHPGLSAMESSRSDASLLAIVQRQRRQPAAFMLMLGDQIYADARAGLLDSSSSLERILPRYREAFGSPGFAALARSTPLYMLMDDHELGDNWSRDLLLRGTAEQQLAGNALAAYRAFQRAHGPNGQGPDGHDARFNIGDCGFFSLNTRIHRERAQRRLLDAAQWPLLEGWLLEQQARGRQPKFILSGSVLAPGLREYACQPAPRDADNWQLAPTERARLLSFIRDNAISNVVFISGDYHCCAAATIRFDASPLVAYALVAPPLHAPLRFANVTASSVLANESIELPGGCAHIEAHAWEGDGWLECALQQQPHGYQLHAQFRFLAMDSADSQEHERRWTLK